jgi:class 3 adenylate cyclase
MDFIHPDAEREQEQETIFYLRESASGDVAARILEEGMFHTDVCHHLTEIVAPTLVMHRREDSAVPLEFGRRIASLLPNARFLPLEGNTHLPFRGDTESIVRAVHEFLSGEALPAAGVEPATAAGAEPAPSGAPVTILFTDIEGSTTLTQSLGDAKAQELLRTHNAIVREAVQARGGSEIKHTGDGIMASFPSASRAVECAIAIQRAISEYNEELLRQAQDANTEPQVANAEPVEAPLGVRIGLNAGEPVAEEEDLFGTAVQAAARICERAQPGQILVSDVVRQLAAGKGFHFTQRGRFLLKGFRERMRLFEVS